MIIFDDYKCSDIRERESVQYLNINLKMRRVTLDCFYSLLGKMFVYLKRLILHLKHYYIDNKLLFCNINKKNEESAHLMELLTGFKNTKLAIHKSCAQHYQIYCKWKQSLTGYKRIEYFKKRTIWCFKI